MKLYLAYSAIVRPRKNLLPFPWGREPLFHNPQQGLSLRFRRSHPESCHLCGAKSAPQMKQVVHSLHVWVSMPSRPDRTRQGLERDCTSSSLCRKAAPASSCTDCIRDSNSRPLPEFKLSLPALAFCPAWHVQPVCSRAVGPVRLVRLFRSLNAARIPLATLCVACRISPPLLAARPCPNLVNRLQLDPRLWVPWMRPGPDTWSALVTCWKSISISRAGVIAVTTSDIAVKSVEC